MYQLHNSYLTNKRTSKVFLIWTLAIFLFSGFTYTFPDRNNKVKRVVIDPGHGGRDPGAIGQYSKEKDIVLAISLQLGKYIEENLPDVEVIFTRTDDSFVPLHERANIANKNKADLFISIHANANPNRNANGAETYAMGLHTDERNLEVAKKENAVIVLEEDYTTQYQGFDPHSAESYIIFSLLQNTFLEQSLHFATYVQNQFRERAQRVDRGVKQAGFLVLWQTTMPSVLIETGFISNPAEEKYLNSTEGQSYLASAIFRAFRDYKESIESRSDFYFVANPPQNNQVTNPLADTSTIRQLASTSFSQDNTPAHQTNIPGTVQFKVQLTASSQRIPTESAFFSNCKNVDENSKIEEFFNSGLYKYVVGNKDSYADIVDYNRNIREFYPDAFIVAIKDGEFIPVSQALSEKN